MTDRYASLKQGLVGCWIPSVSGSGLLLPDLSGRGNNGSLVGMDASDWVSSQYGRALDFDGTNDYVTSAAYYDAGSLSFSFWAYFSGTPANYPMVLQWRRPNQANATQSMQVLFRPTGDVFGGSTPDSASGNRISFAINGATTATTHPFFAMTANTWQHWAGTYDGSNLRLFNSGVLRMAVAGSFANTAGAWNVDIANNRVSPSDGYFKGQLDDIRIYNRALTESEIRLLASEPGIGFKPAKKLSRFSQRYTYNPPKARNYGVVRVKETDYGTLRQGLVGAWCPSLPNGGSGNTLPDVSGYGNHAALLGMDATAWVSSGTGTALSFDGVNDYLEPTCSAIGTADYTISGWYRQSSAANRLDMFCPSNNIATVSTGYNFPFMYVRQTVVAISIDPRGAYEATNTGDTNWHNLVAFRRNGVVKMFKDGTEVTLVSSGTNFDQNGYSFAGSTFRCQRLNLAFVPSDIYSTGQLNDLRIYNRALSEPEIKLLASRPGIGLRQDRDRNTFYQFPSGARRKRILTGMP